MGVKLDRGGGQAEYRAVLISVEATQNVR